MRYLRKIFESEVVEFDLNFAMSKIKEHFSEERVIEMYDDEVLEWVDDDWEDDYESEYDWYIDHNNGEAQDVIIDVITSWFSSEFNKSLGADQHCELHDAIKEKYTCLS